MITSDSTKGSEIMKRIFTACLSLMILFGAESAFAADAAMKADNQAIDSACAADAQTAGCGSEIVGHGLLKCLHAYKRANKSFKLSDSCKSAMKQRHADKAAGK
jgi:hypothetical protein